MRRHLLPSLVLPLALAMAGCGGDEPTGGEAAGESGSTPSAAPAPDAADEPAPGPARREPDGDRPPGQHPTAAPGSGPGAGLPVSPRRALPGATVAARTTGPAVHLLTAAALPGPDGVRRWQLTVDGPEGESLVGACQKTPLAAIGAVSADRRVHLGSGPAAGAARVSQVVGRFADRRSALRAHRVLVAWHADCADRMRGSVDGVGPAREVAVGSGVAAAYAASYGVRGGRVDTVAGLGILRHGRWLAVVEVAAPPAAWSGSVPAEVAAARAARRVARTFA